MVSSTTTKFLYDGWNVIQEQGSSGTPTANLLTGLGLDEVFSRTDSAGARSFLADPLGSTIAFADNAGVVQTSYTYEPFGKATQSGQSSTNPFQFTGRENDGTAPGLYSYRARYLNPTYGRFISEDPIGFAAGDPNLYAYVGNGSTYRRDPLGLVGWPLPPPEAQGQQDTTAGRKDWWSRNCGILALGCVGDFLWLWDRLTDAWNQSVGAWEGLRKDWEFAQEGLRRGLADVWEGIGGWRGFIQCLVTGAKSYELAEPIAPLSGPAAPFVPGAAFVAGCFTGIFTPPTPP